MVAPRAPDYEVRDRGIDEPAGNARCVEPPLVQLEPGRYSVDHGDVVLRRLDDVVDRRRG